ASSPITPRPAIAGRWRRARACDNLRFEPGLRVWMNDAADEVPWSVAWSGEQAFRVQPSRDFPGRFELDQRPAPGVGQPLFAAVHVTRQRRGMVDLLCHVCGRPTAPNDRYIFPTASGGLVTMQDGSQQYGCNVPPMHLACASRALAACPPLAKIRQPPLR